MKKIFLLLAVLICSNVTFAQNVGIGISSPSAKLHIKGLSDATQLIIDANSPQNNSNPLIKLRTNSGNDLLWIHSDDTRNSFVGLNAGRVNDAAGGGSANTFIGSSAGYSNSTGNANTANGWRALYSNTIGIANTANGFGTLLSNSTGNSNVANGAYALYYNTTGGNNTAIGNNALFLQSYNPGATWSSQNVAVGYQALYSNQPTSTSNGICNTAVGTFALVNNTTGGNNTAVGKDALFSNNTGFSNVALGIGALRLSINRSNLVAIGDSALFNNGTGASLSEHSTRNTAVGSKALNQNTTGYYNTAIGYNTLLNNTSGFGNTALGYFADVTSPVLTNATAIGGDAKVNASNKVRIGNTSVTVVEGAAAYTVSDARFKTNIQKASPGLDFILQLQPVTYHFNYLQLAKQLGEKNYVESFLQQRSQQTEMGLLAQQVEQVCIKLGIDISNLVHKPDNEKDNYSLAYGNLVVPLIKAVQEQEHQIEILKEKLQEMDNIKLRLAQLESKINNQSASLGNPSLIH